MKKRITALLLAGVMMLSLCACGGGGTQIEDNEVSMTLISSSNSPFDENWKIWDYIEEATGLELNIHAIPTDYLTKVSLMFAAPDTLTDIVSFNWKTDTDKYAQQGALIAFDDIEDDMPNYKKWKDSLTEEQYQHSITTRLASDGKVYYSPSTGEEETGGRAWLYRQDIFEKHNLKVPTNFDELYAVCKELKALYPDSYPLSIGAGKMSFINAYGSSFKKWWSAYEYYDFDNDEWHWGMYDDMGLEVIKFHKQMIDEEIMPPNLMTLSNTGWEELMSTNRSFIVPNFTTRIDFFKAMAGNSYPEFKLNIMAPPVLTEQGVPMIENRTVSTVGVVLPNTGDETGIANAKKLVDWMYSDEAVDLVSWGKEGETYEVRDGKKQYITDEYGSQASTLFGIKTYATYTRFDPEAALMFESDAIKERRELRIEHTLPYTYPTLWLAYNEEEQRVIDEVRAACLTRTQEMFTKFILGQEPISKFDAFREELKEMGIDELLAAYESAYNRVK